jgi:hypothetical protein
MKSIFVVILGGSVATSAFAATWVPVGQTVLRKYYIDSGSLAAGADPARAWVKIDLRRDSTAKVDHALGLWEFRCAIHAVRIASRTNYARDGALVDTEQFTDAPFVDVIPGSIEQAIEAVVCAHGAPRDRR